MNNYPAIRRSLLLRLGLSLPFFVAGWLMATRASGGWAAAGPALIGMGMILAGAVIVAPGLATLIAEPAGSIYMPTDHADRPAPMYGIADARRAKGDYEGAMLHLDSIAVSDPQQLDAYVKMIDIAVVDLRDLKRAETAYHRGIAALANDGDKSALSVMYRALMSRYKDPARPQAIRPLPLPSRPSDP